MDSGTRICISSILALELGTQVPNTILIAVHYLENNQLPRNASEKRTKQTVCIILNLLTHFHAIYPCL